MVKGTKLERVALGNDQRYSENPLTRGYPQASSLYTRSVSTTAKVWAVLTSQRGLRYSLLRIGKYVVL